MKRIPMLAAALAAMKKMAFAMFCGAVIMIVVAPAWAADPCTAPSLGTPATGIGTAMGCGAVITVTSVNGSGVATAFTVTSVPGSGNPFDTGLDDTLVGIQNNSTSTLNSINLSSPVTTPDSLFNFETNPPDGVCAQNPKDCFLEGGTGYEGPHNFFENFSLRTSGTVNFVVDIEGTGIPAGGSTWFALEGTPTSFGSISQTQILQPGVTAIYPANNDNSKWTPINNAGGESLTVTAVPFLQETFIPPTAFASQSCVPYKDFTDANNGAFTCLGIQTDCKDTLTSNDCATLLYDVMTNYDLPDALPAIGGPDFLVFHGQKCPPDTTKPAQSIFRSYSVNRFDPVHKGGGGGTSCYIATYTPLAQPITSGTFSTFEGFELFVSNTKINPIFQGLPEILVWDLKTNLGVPVPDLHLCNNTSGTCNAPWVNLRLIPIPNAATSHCPVGFPPTGSLPSLFKLGLKKGDEVGEYVFVWDTSTKVKNLKGCQVSVVLTFDSGLVVVPAKFQYKF